MEHKPALASLPERSSGNTEAAEKLDNRRERHKRRLSKVNGSATTSDTREPPEPKASSESRKTTVWDFRARGEPFIWGVGGALVIGVLMIIGFVVLIIYNGVSTFYPKPVEVAVLRDGSMLAGEFVRSDIYRPGPDKLGPIPKEIAEKIVKEDNGKVKRRLYRIGNFDLYNGDFKWVPEYDISKTDHPRDMYFFERLEWGPFIGRIW